MSAFAQTQPAAGRRASREVKAGDSSLDCPRSTFPAPGDSLAPPAKLSAVLWRDGLAGGGIRAGRLSPVRDHMGNAALPPTNFRDAPARVPA
jgi:hypothetical protein